MRKVTIISIMLKYVGELFLLRTCYFWMWKKCLIKKFYLPGLGSFQKFLILKISDKQEEKIPKTVLKTRVNPK
jgi:hypothetical protein